MSCVPFGLMSQAPVRPMLASTIEMPLTVFVTDRADEQERTAGNDEVVRPCSGSLPCVSRPGPASRWPMNRRSSTMTLSRGAAYFLVSDFEQIIRDNDCQESVNDAARSI